MTSTVSTSRGMQPPPSLGSLESSHLTSASIVLVQPDTDTDADDKAELLSVSWNQNYGCFAAGTTNGFRLYNCHPFKENIRRDLESGGFGIVEMLFRTNILALVGGGENPQYPPNKVMLWDDHQGRCIGEFTFRSVVHGVKLRRDHIVVVLEHRIYVYSILDLKLIQKIDTLSNPRGLCCLSHHPSTSILACPGIRQGQVRVENFGKKVIKIITAHDSNIACFTLTLEGHLLATASMKGTLIRIFDTKDGTQLQEVHPIRHSLCNHFGSYVSLQIALEQIR